MKFQIQQIILLVLLFPTFGYLLYLLSTRMFKPSILTDNIFSNLTSLEKTKSGNVSSKFSDHLLQFFFLPNFL